MSEESTNLLTFGGHLEVLRKMLFRILTVVGIISIIIFCFKEVTWNILLAPSDWDFYTYNVIENFFHFIGVKEFHFDKFYVDLIATDLSSQFMTHITTSFYLGLLCSSPYILYELFRFISPALYENERKYSVYMLFVVYFLFIIGVLMSYFVLFPISFRFLGTYSVAEKVHSNITLDSYISAFITLTLMMGVVFQLPIIAFILSKMSIIQSSFMAKYRKHAFIIILLVAAIITPPDLMTLILVAIPLFLLYEISIRITQFVENNNKTTKQHNA